MYWAFLNTESVEENLFSETYWFEDQSSVWKLKGFSNKSQNPVITYAPSYHSKLEFGKVEYNLKNMYI